MNAAPGLSRCWDFIDAPPWIGIAVFVVSSIVVWFSGTRITHYADAIAVKTALGASSVGVLLVATSTSLPQVSSVLATYLGGIFLLYRMR